MRRRGGRRAGPPGPREVEGTATGGRRRSSPRGRRAPSGARPSAPPRPVRGGRRGPRRSRPASGRGVSPAPSRRRSCHRRRAAPRTARARASSQTAANRDCSAGSVRRPMHELEHEASARLAARASLPGRSPDGQAAAGDRVPIPPLRRLPTSDGDTANLAHAEVPHRAPAGTWTGGRLPGAPPWGAPLPRREAG